MPGKLKAYSLFFIFFLLFYGCSTVDETKEIVLDYNQLQDKFHKIIQKVHPSIVAISTRPNSIDIGFGTGVIIDESGLILTSEHVVSNAKQIGIYLSDLRIFNAKILNSDETTDLAILKIEKVDNLIPIEFGNSSTIAVGDIIFSLGNSFGHSSRDGQPTVTQGIISALNRVATSLTSSRRYWNAIQHDASVNPGNSGGPLIDINGKMIGLNGVINSQSGNNAGVSFAIPVNIIKKYLPKLKSGEIIKHPYIGIADLNNIMTQINESNFRGVQIGLVSPDSPASKAGLKENDIVVSADDKLINNSVDLYNWLYNKDVNDKVKFQVIRFNNEKTEVDILPLEFKLGTHPEK